MVEWALVVDYWRTVKENGNTYHERRTQTKSFGYLSQVAESQDIIVITAQRSLKRVFRIVAYVKRISFICKYKAKYPNFITPSELIEAINNLLRQEQKKFFSDEVKMLQTSPQVEKSSKI